MNQANDFPSVTSEEAHLALTWLERQMPLNWFWRTHYGRDYRAWRESRPEVVAWNHYVLIILEVFHHFLGEHPAVADVARLPDRVRSFYLAASTDAELNVG